MNLYLRNAILTNKLSFLLLHFLSLYFAGLTRDQVNLPLRTLFEAPTIAELVLRFEAHQQARKCRLSGAGFANNTEHLAFFQGEGNATDR